MLYLQKDIVWPSALKAPGPLSGSNNADVQHGLEMEAHEGSNDAPEPFPMTAWVSGDCIPNPCYPDA